jgi:ATP-dependent Clp protease ATP-binding subunit ClpX
MGARVTSVSVTESVVNRVYQSHRHARTRSVRFRAMKPPEISASLEHQVIGQRKALCEISVALYKHLIGHKTGNVLMIGGSGTGKTTIMRAVEKLLRESDVFEEHSTVVRINANLLADFASRGVQSSVVLEKLVAEARIRIGEDATRQDIVKSVSHGIVFIDEIDKIRSHVGDEPNVNGIVAQESLLTLMEGEMQSVNIGARNEQGQWESIPTGIDTSTILFVAGGAFEDLYDQVFDRVTAHGKNPPWRLVTKADGTMERQIVFQLAQHLVHADLFAYGMAPQFLARFDSIVTLRNLSPSDLATIFKDTPDAMLPIAKEYFQVYGVTLKIDDDAVNFIVDKAAANSRLGARALKEVFGRIIKQFEYDPWVNDDVTDEKGKNELLITIDMVQNAYATD